MTNAVVNGLTVLSVSSGQAGGGLIVNGTATVNNLQAVNASSQQSGGALYVKGNSYVTGLSATNCSAGKARRALPFPCALLPPQRLRSRGGLCARRGRAARACSWAPRAT